SSRPIARPTCATCTWPCRRPCSPRRRTGSGAERRTTSGTTASSECPRWREEEERLPATGCRLPAARRDETGRDETRDSLHVVVAAPVDREECLEEDLPLDVLEGTGQVRDFEEAGNVE